MIVCLNCENKFEGEFCNICGQSSSTHRFTMREWAKEIPRKLLNIEKGFFGTMKSLFLRPGISIREYLKGKRKLLINPFVYVLVMCGVYIVLSSMFAQNPTLEVTENQELTKDIFKLSAYIQKEYYKIIIIVMILPMTIGTSIAYLRSNYNFAENLVLNAYLIGQLVIGDMILLFLGLILEFETNKNVFLLADLFLKYPYWFWVYYNFFKPSKWYWGILQFILSLIILNISLMLMLLATASIFRLFQS